MTDRPGFRVAVEPHLTGELAGKFDIYVKDANGNALLHSNQGYANRQDAVNLAMRLFANARTLAGHLGIDPVDGFDGEAAELLVYDFQGNLDYTKGLRLRSDVA